MTVEFLLCSCDVIDWIAPKLAPLEGGNPLAGEPGVVDVVRDARLWGNPAPLVDKLCGKPAPLVDNVCGNPVPLVDKLGGNPLPLPDKLGGNPLLLLDKLGGNPLLLLDKLGGNPEPLEGRVWGNPAPLIPHDLGIPKGLEFSKESNWNKYIVDQHYLNFHFLISIWNHEYIKNL